MELFVGVDWAEDHHDVCVVDAGGRVVAKGRVPQGIAGVARLHELVDLGGMIPRRRWRSWSGSRPTEGCWYGHCWPLGMRWWR